MINLVGKYLVINNQLTISDKLKLPKGANIYEIFRVINYKPIFLIDHLNRLINSHNINSYKLDFNIFLIKESIQKLIHANDIKMGNIKIIINHSDKQQIFIFQIPHQYPAANLYSIGVKCDLHHFEREAPNAKMMRTSPQAVISEQSKANYFETLIYNKNKEITEGSRTNVFFIKEDNIFTPPGKDVLKGITREKVLLICKKLKINVLETTIKSDELSNYDAVFLTGTSPKVLPVQSINQIKYKANNPLTGIIKNQYDKLIDEDITQFKW